MALTFANEGASASPDSSSTAGSQTYTSAAAWTPATHDLVICAVLISHTAGNTGSNPTMSGNGLTWVQIARFSSTASTTTLVLFAADNSAGGATNGTTTVDMTAGFSGNGCEMLFAYADGVDLSGGVAAAFVQAVTGEGTSATPSITLSAAGNSNNRPFAMWNASGSGLSFTPGTNWTELDDLGHSTPNRKSETEYRSDAFDTAAGTTISSSSAYTGIAFEIKAGSGSQTVTLGLIDNSGSVFGPTVQPGQVSVTSALIDQSGVVFAPQVNLGVALGLIDQSGVVFAPQVNQSVALSLIDQSGVVFAPTISQTGAQQTVTLDLIDQSGVVFAPQVNQQVVLDLIDQSGVVFAPAAQPGQVSIAPGLIDQSGVVFAPQVNQVVALDLIDNSGQVFAPGTILEVALPLISNIGQVFAPTISQDGAPAPSPGSFFRLRRKRWTQEN